MHESFTDFGLNIEMFSIDNYDICKLLKSLFKKETNVTLAVALAFPIYCKCTGSRSFVTFFTSFPTVNPCTRMEKTTTI